MEEFTDNNQNINSFENPEPQRPNGLTVACVLSFINAGLQFISNIFSYLAYNMMHELAQSEEYYEMMEKFMPDMDEFETAMEAQLAVPRISYLLTALLFAGSFIGVLYMWRMLKKGFHIYAIAQILMLIVTALMVVPVTGASMAGPVVLTAIWIGIYFIYYRKTLK